MTNHAQSIGASAPAVFSFESHCIRTVADEQGNPLFCASDVCEVLGYANSRDALSKHCKERGVAKRDTPTTSGLQSMTFISEGNLYRLIVKSRKPEAERFESWLMDDVLPALRQQGSYTMPSAAANVALSGVAMLDDVPVLTMQRLAACFGMSIDPIRRNRELFPERFVHGVHWFRLEGDALRRFGLANLHTGEVSRNFGRSMIVWTEAGAQMHAACFAPAQGKTGLAAVAAYLRGEVAPSASARVPAPEASLPWPVSPADLAGGRRVLLSLNRNGVVQAEPVPSGAFLLTSAELAQQIAAPDSLWSRDELRAVGSAVMARLARWG